MKGIELLQKNKLRKTKIREAVLNCFLEADSALNNQDIEQGIQDNFDRITLYRTLNTFVKAGIIHKIELGSETHYGLCQQCTSDHHDDDHIHFKCNLCETVQCIDHNSSFSYSIPKGFQVSKANILLEGTCDDCSNP